MKAGEINSSKPVFHMEGITLQRELPVMTAVEQTWLFSEHCSLVLWGQKQTPQSYSVLDLASSLPERAFSCFFAI